MQETNVPVKVSKARRRWEILEYMRNAPGRSQIATLSHRFGVSEMTIRRNLHALAHQGLIAVAGKEVYLAPSTTITEETYQLKLADNRSEKLAIAKAAVIHLQENMTVFLDGGTTVGALAPILVSMKRITVVSNALNIVNVLCSSPGIRLICIGGTLRPASQTFLGAKAEALMKQLRVDLAFLGTESFSVSTGLEVPDEGDASFKEVVIRSSRKRVLMATSNKLNQTRLYNFADWESIDHLITDGALPNDVDEELSRWGVTICRAT